MNFDQAFDRLLAHEGSYSFHRSDRGGETMWGITAVVARSQGYTGHMADLPQLTAKYIYKKCYWMPVQADQLPWDIRFDVFDGAVNSGVTQSAIWLQRALGVDDDGIIGPVTINACKSVPGGLLLAQYNGHRLAYLCDLSGWHTFGRGWALRIARNLSLT